MKVRCERWGKCKTTKCPEWPEHEEQKECRRKYFCSVANTKTKCVKVAPAAAVVERKDDSA